MPTINGATTEIFAVEDLVESAVLVAVSTTVVLVVTVGAVYKPLLETVPFEAVQFTAVLEVFVTAARNCAVAPEFTLLSPGERVMPTGATTETFALTDFVESAALVAVRMAVVFVVTAGAVYKPLLETVPLDVDQLTVVFDVFVTAA